MRWVVCFYSLFVAFGLHAEEAYFYDTQQVRYHLYQTHGGEPYNWLFLPGGPGADSSYLTSLIDGLHLPGNVWLIDLPGNGTNSVTAPDYERWMTAFPALLRHFENPILVGHSFGGMFPLLFPELETVLKGFVILNSVPVLYMEEAVAYAAQFHLPDLTPAMIAFNETPNETTFAEALKACIPYYFPPATLEKGGALVMQLPFPYEPAVWWQKKIIALNFSAQWVPQEVPTLVVGAKFDCICPVTLFQKDERFHRPNIEFLFVEEGGHFPWLENPQALQKAFEEFITRLAPSSEEKGELTGFCGESGEISPS